MITEIVSHPSQKAFEPQREFFVRDLMTEEVFTATTQDTLEFIMELMKWRKCRHIPILDGEEKLVGIVTQRDCLSVSISKLAEASVHQIKHINRALKVEDFMTTDVVVVNKDLPLKKAARILFEKKYGCLPVVDSAGHVLGILTEADFVRGYFDFNWGGHLDA